MTIPPKLAVGDEIRVLALSRSLGGVMGAGGMTEADVQFAVRTLESLGLRVSFGAHVYERNAHLTTSPEHRLEDLHDALNSASVKAILAVTGGIGAIQLLDGVDYALVGAQPKILCGYSDVAYISNAIWTRSAVVTYYGPNFTSFMMRKGGEYTLQHFRQCCFDTAALHLQPAEVWSDDPWHKDQENRTFLPNEGLWSIHPGEAEGTILGGSYWCLNLLQGSSYFPDLRNSVLFLEGPAEGKATLMNLDSALRALAFHPAFCGVRGIVLGRFARSGGVTRENLTELIASLPALKNLPIVANCDLGHTTPVFTLPIGGWCVVKADNSNTTIRVTVH